MGVKFRDDNRKGVENLTSIICRWYSVDGRINQDLQHMWMSLRERMVEWDCQLMLVTIMCQWTETIDGKL